MPSYEHKKLVEEITLLDMAPSDVAKFTEWIQARRHLEFLLANARAKEILIYAAAPHIFIYSLVVPNQALVPVNQDDLLRWSTGPDNSAASYVSGGDGEEMWIERDAFSHGCRTLEAATNLIYSRTFDGWTGSDRTYIEANQEYTHLADIHWRPEHKSYCRFDENGDLDHKISITAKEKFEDVRLVSFSWEELETYLAVSDSSLVRLFDFKLLNFGSFASWPDIPENMFELPYEFFYRQRIGETCSSTRGVQIIRPKKTAADVAKEENGTVEENDKQHVEFIAHDFRNERIIKISTSPKSTTNYFQAKDNDLPYELSPAFFRAEVLLKYKGDREKYTVGDRDLSSRGGWMLRSFDVNEAGQIHAYICDLRALPYTEQLHWLSFNEVPKAGISAQAFTSDFKGEWSDSMNPLSEIQSLLRTWHRKKTPFWALRNEVLLDSISKPLSPSRDEWSEAFMDLSKLIAEGFQVKDIRARLDAAKVQFPKEEQSIVLLERLLGNAQGAPVTLGGLRTIQRIRSKVKGHTGSSEAEQIVQQAISDYGSFARHFESVCVEAFADLQLVDSLTSVPTG